MTDKIVTGQLQTIIIWMTNIFFCIQNPSLPGHPSCSSQTENTQNPCRLQQQLEIGEHAVFKMEKSMTALPKNTRIFLSVNAFLSNIFLGNMWSYGISSSL